MFRDESQQARQGTRKQQRRRRMLIAWSPAAMAATKATSLKFRSPANGTACRRLTVTIVLLAGHGVVYMLRMPPSPGPGHVPKRFRDLCQEPCCMLPWGSVPCGCYLPVVPRWDGHGRVVVSE